MKRILSFILASLLLTSAVTSCGQNSASETEKAETKAPETSVSETTATETSISETVIAETDVPAVVYPYDTSLITENGEAKAHIVVFDGATSELTAANELVSHIKLISGADIAVVTNEVQEDSLPIIIATPDTLPELETLFPEDLAWLRDLGNPKEGERFGDDGFAIRMKDGKLYIFGATARGALNGTYDFIEDNFDVLWIRNTAMSEYATIYDEMPTMTLKKVDYREKSPFDYRALASESVWASRNKMTNGHLSDVTSIGGVHSVASWILNSPSYDPNCYEYWETDINGKHDTTYVTTNAPQRQINFWSDITMQCVADSVLAYLDANYASMATHKYIQVSLMDGTAHSVYPEMTEPFEYEPGKFVNPEDPAYISTVWFTFINKVAKIVGEKYPDVNIQTLAYLSTINPPVCELEDNVYAILATIGEDLSTNIDNPAKIDAYKDYKALMAWTEKSPNVQVYNYYGCQVTLSFFTRPIWYRMQSDMQIYAEAGFSGVCPEGIGDHNGTAWAGGFSSFIHNERTTPYLLCSNSWTMNALTFWIFAKLAWNPYEDVDALIEYYCDRVYGEGSEYMQEYYRLLYVSWQDGGEAMAEGFNMNFIWWTGLEVLWDYFFDIEVDGVHILTALQEALHNAYDAADERGKSHILYMMENFDRMEYLVWGD